MSEGRDKGNEGKQPKQASEPLPTPAPAVARVRSPTFADEEELEGARPAGLSERPGPNSSASLLSLANAYAASTSRASSAGIVPTAGTAEPGDATPATPTEERDAAHPADLLAEMRDRFSLGDYSGALLIAERVLEMDPANAEALRRADDCRAVLHQMYTARLGPLDRVPILMVARDQLRWLSVDHRAGFVLSHVDGASSLETIIDLSGMPRLDALRILAEFVREAVIAFR